MHDHCMVDLTLNGPNLMLSESALITAVVRTVFGSAT